MSLRLKLFLLALALHANGNLIVFYTYPIQVCIGWPDDNTPSYICTPDYSIKEPNDD